MKNLKIAVVALFATAAVSAQDLAKNQVPTNLNESFQKAYPNATDVEWEMDGMNYKVEFDMNKMENEVWYSKEGNIIKSEMELTEKDLPGAIATAVKNKYPEYSIDEVEVTEVDGKKTYEVELEKWFSEDIKLFFSEDGSILKTGK